MTVFKRPVCLRCGGSRQVTCHICGGTGELAIRSLRIIIKGLCKQCRGTGKECCPVCKGIGVMVRG